MARTWSPLLSLDASGTVADAITFSKWKGRNYVRTRVTPANPQSPGQFGMREMMKFLSQHWGSMSASDKSDWEEDAQNAAISPFNAYVKYNLARWRDGLGPKTRHSPTPSTITNHISSTVLDDQGRNIIAQVTLSGATEAFIATLHLSQTSPFTPTWNNTRQVRLVTGLEFFAFNVGPLDPGTYYARYRLWSKTGLPDDTYTEEDSVTVV